MAVVSGWRALFVAAVVFAANVAAFTQTHQRRCTRAANSCRRHSQATPELEMAEGGSIESSPFVVALTREEGKNDKLRNALLSNERVAGLPVQIYELPCIEHADCPDTDKLAPTLASSQFDYVAITSPEAAKVMASAWIEAGRPKLGNVAAVGKATQEALTQYGIEVAFVPSKATAATLVKELPPSDTAVDAGRATTLLYPASAKAQETLQKGLEKRGFDVTRLNTYDTVPASWSDEQISLAQSATIACFASPSAVKAWLKNTAELQTPRALACCIGETSASACRENQWEESNIFYPEKPGVDGWANAVAEALECMAEK
ncbi:hypothetical protein ACHAXT_000486 [Thalassiosira profunda]